MNQLDELIPFLLNSKPEIRKIAIQYVRSCTGNEEGKIELKKRNAIVNLVKLLGDIEIIAKDALTCLVNLSEDEENCNLMTQKNVIPMCVQHCFDPESNMNELSLLLLCNVTHSESACKKLLQVGEELEGFFIYKLIAKFIENPGNNNKDQLGWIGIVLTNITQIPEGRKLILNKEKKIITKDLLKFTTHINPIRRRGIAGALKNCLFEENLHDWLLSDEVNILPYLILPFVGKYAYSNDEVNELPLLVKEQLGKKESEADAQNMKLFSECLLQLTRTRAGRDLMRAYGVYIILREFHKTEEILLSEDTNDILMKVIEFMLRKEAPIVSINSSANVEPEPIDLSNLKLDE